MHHGAARYLIFGELGFLALIAVCIVIRPWGLSANQGISYYGNHADTLIPYVLALSTSSYFTFKAAGALPSNHKWFRSLRLPLNLFAAGFIGIVATPYSLNTYFSWAHEIIGALLFGAQLILTLSLTAEEGYPPSMVALLIIQILGVVIGGLSLQFQHGYLLQGQLVFQLAFGLILIRYIYDGFKRFRKRRSRR